MFPFESLHTSSNLHIFHCNHRCLHISCMKPLPPWYSPIKNGDVLARSLQDRDIHRSEAAYNRLTVRLEHLLMELRRWRCPKDMVAPGGYNKEIQGYYMCVQFWMCVISIYMYILCRLDILWIDIYIYINNICITCASYFMNYNIYIYIYAHTMWAPPVISWFISTSNYSYKYHKP